MSASTLRIPPGASSGTPVVLVVDDNTGFLRVIRPVLEHGVPAFEVHTAKTGEDAIAFLAREGHFAGCPRPAFVVLDFHLPDTDAPELLRSIRAKRELARVPVLVLTQTYWAEDDTAAMAAGADRFHGKPSDLTALHDIVTEFWRDVVSPHLS